MPIYTYVDIFIYLYFFGKFDSFQINTKFCHSNQPNRPTLVYGHDPCFHILIPDVDKLYFVVCLCFFPATFLEIHVSHIPSWLKNNLRLSIFKIQSISLFRHESEP